MRRAALTAAAPSTALRPSPNRVPSSAVVVRAEKPCARYRTTNIIVEEPIRLTSGEDPASSAGSMNLNRTAKAKPSPTSASSPRSRATAPTTG